MHLLDAYHRAHPRHQLEGVERFNHVIVRPRVQATDLVFLGGLRREQNHGNPLVLLILAQPSEDFQPVHVRHHIIEKDHIWQEGRHFFQRLRPVGGALDHIALVLELLLQQIEIERLVIDD